MAGSDKSGWEVFYVVLFIFVVGLIWAAIAAVFGGDDSRDYRSPGQQLQDDVEQSCRAQGYTTEVEILACKVAYLEDQGALD